MLVADITFSPYDAGYYARVWNTKDGKDIATVPDGDAVKPTREALMRCLRKEYGSIAVRDLTA